jgi:serine/threonine-protein kinase
MSFWDRVKERLFDPSEGDAPDASDPEPARDRVTPVAPRRAAPSRRGPDMSRFGAPGGPTEAEALAALLAARGGEDEARILAALVASPASLTDALAVACAEVLVVRGEEERAMEILEGRASAPALMLSSDLAAARGETARALGAIERVLARDVAAPGAMERHARLADLLGARRGPVRRLDEATMVASAPADTPFRIEREVARGGAGSVYEAFDEVLGRKVAFKVYHGAADDRVMALREVRLATRFAGPYVVRVLDASPEAGWVALEWAAQGSLRDWLRAGRAAELLPPKRWALPLARAIARIHRAGFVHADVKPTNVLLNGPDAPLLSDFGIARPAGAPAAGGSAGYVSPERLGGAPASFLDDVYGFGRTVEDVLAAAKGAAHPEVEALVRACVGPAAARPADGARLVELLAATSHS